MDGSTTALARLLDVVPGPSVEHWILAPRSQSGPHKCGIIVEHLRQGLCSIHLLRILCESTLRGPMEICREFCRDSFNSYR